MRNIFCVESEYEKRLLSILVFLKVEVKNIINNQNQIMQRIENIEKTLNEKSNYSHAELIEMSAIDDCPFPVDVEADLLGFEDKILGDKTFKYKLVCY